MGHQHTGNRGCARNGVSVPFASSEKGTILPHRSFNPTVLEAWKHSCVVGHPNRGIAPIGDL